MATKKQKRAAAEAKRAEFMAELKADGLKALQASRGSAAKRKEVAKAEAEKINRRHQTILLNAGDFQDVMDQQLEAINRQWEAWTEKQEDTPYTRVYGQRVEGPHASS